MTTAGSWVWDHVGSDVRGRLHRYVGRRPAALQLAFEIAGTAAVTLVCWAAGRLVALRQAKAVGRRLRPAARWALRGPQPDRGAGGSE